MGNSTSKSTSSARPSSSSSSKRTRSTSRGKSSSSGAPPGGKATGGTSTSAASSTAADFPTRAQQMVGESYRDLQQNIQSGIKRLEEQDHPAAQLLDSICSPYLETKGSFYSSDNDDSHTVSEDETTATDPYHSAAARKGGGARNKGASSRHDDPSTGGSESYMSTSDYESVEVVKPPKSQSRRPAAAGAPAATATAASAKESTDDESNGEANLPAAAAIHHNSKKQPLASSFAKRCFFTKAGIGGQTQHYEGLTLTGNVVLMLASAMKLKGCPTICDEDLRRVEQTYPNQFSRLPDELLLSSGWRRISKYCHFSNKPIPDGVPFFHSKQRLHPSGGYYFLLAAAVGMVRPIDVEPLTRDTLVLLETDYPTACDSAPPVLIQDPNQWTLVDKFCFFSGGPINQEEDVYYQADFDGNPIYMLAFLSPSLTPLELYKLDSEQEPLTTVAAVQEVESVYDLTERDFDDLKLYHLGPCRALPQYILQPHAWTKVLPPHFLEARETALIRAQELEGSHYSPAVENQYPYARQHPQQIDPHSTEYEQPDESNYSYDGDEMPDELDPVSYNDEYARQVEEEGAFSPSEQFAARQQNSDDLQDDYHAGEADAMLHHDPRRLATTRMDPPEDEPPSLKRGEDDSYYHDNASEDMNKSPEDEWDDPEHQIQDDHEYYESRDVGKYYVTSDESPSEGVASPPSALSPSEADFDDRSPSSNLHQTSPRHRSSDLPPISPRSPGNSDVYSQHSSAMKGAQELLRRNRQRRAAAAATQPNSSSPTTKQFITNADPATQASDDGEHVEGRAVPNLASPNTDSESGNTWESGSDFTGSSVWTDGSFANPDRSSRRALILQMAKARMKSNKKTEEKKMDELDLRDELD